MADYFEEMGWTPLQNGEAPNEFVHLAHLLLDFNMFEELGTNKDIPPPASQEFVENLKKEAVQGTEFKCPVCLKASKPGDVSISLSCKHTFHSECILQWLKRTNSCPLCRLEMPTDDNAYEKYRKEKLRAKERVNDLRNLHDSMFL